MQILINNIFFWVDRSKSRVNFAKRFIAYLIDWFLGGVIGGFPAVCIYAMVTDSSDMLGSLYDIPAKGYSEYWSYLMGSLSLIVAFIYFVVIPLKKYPGQTIGKKIMNIKIMRIDGKQLDLKTLFIRQVLGLMILEGTAVAVSTYLLQMLTLLTKTYVENYTMFVIYALTIASTSLVFLTPSSRSLHDYMAKTRVALSDEEFQEQVIKNSKKRNYK